MGKYIDEQEINEPLVSVIVPVYNSEQYLDRCIKSVINQTYRNIEIILVNDGSGDNSITICKKYEQIDSRVVFCSQQNRGSTAARKRGLEFAKGELVGFIDSDDWIEPEMYEELVKCYMTSNCNFISSGIICDFQNGKESIVLYDHYTEGKYTELETKIYPTMLYDFENRGFGLYCNLWNKLFEKEVLKKVFKDIDERIFYGEDAITTYSYCLLCKNIYILHKSFYHYNIREGSVCSITDERLLQNSYLLYNGLKKIFLNYKEPYILMRQLKRYMIDIESHNLRRLYGIEFASFAAGNFNYPKEILDAKIVIYGAGIYGQALYHYLLAENKEKIIVSWVDRDFKNKSDECLYQIQPVETIQNLGFDFLIIAVKNENVAMEIRKNLINQYNVDANKIIWKEEPYKYLLTNMIF